MPPSRKILGRDGVGPKGSGAAGRRLIDRVVIDPSVVVAEPFAKFAILFRNRAFRVSGILRAVKPTGMTVLVVDDDRDAREIYSTYLEHAGCNVITASDGEAAIDAAHRSLPDVIVMDLAMPGMDGFRATRSLKRSPDTAQIPIIALTAAMTAREAARDAGCDAFLAKPCLPDLLLWEMRALLLPLEDAQNSADFAPI